MSPAFRRLAWVGVIAAACASSPATGERPRFEEAADAVFVWLVRERDEASRLPGASPTSRVYHLRGLREPLEGFAAFADSARVEAAAEFQRNRGRNVLVYRGTALRPQDTIVTISQAKAAAGGAAEMLLQFREDDYEMWCVAILERVRGAWTVTDCRTFYIT